MTGSLLAEMNSGVVATQPPERAHVVQRVTNYESAVALVMRARVEGFPVKALCGVQFVPQRDPAVKPVCEKCELLFDFYADLGHTDIRQPRHLPQ